MMWDPFQKLHGWLTRHGGEPLPPPVPPQPDPAGIEELVSRYGEDYRPVIERVVQDIFLMAETDKRINLATFNFNRYVAAAVFNHSIGLP